MSDIVCMTLPLREIAVGEAASTILELRAEVMRCRAEARKWKDCLDIAEMSYRHEKELNDLANRR